MTSHYLKHRKPFNEVVKIGDVMYQWYLAYYLPKCCLNRKMYEKHSKEHRMR